MTSLPKVHAHQEEGDDKDGGERDPDGVECVLPHGQVLLVEDVEDRVGEDVDVLLRVATDVHPLRHGVRELPGSAQGGVVVFRVLQDRVERHEVVRSNLRDDSHE